MTTGQMADTADMKWKFSKKLRLKKFQVSSNNKGIGMKEMWSARSPCIIFEERNQKLSYLLPRSCILNVNQKWLEA